LINNTTLFLFKNNTQSWGIVEEQSGSSMEFKIEAGTNSKTVKLANDSYAIDSDFLFINRKAFDSLEIPLSNAWYWVKISHQYANYETGTINVSTDGNVTGFSTLFIDILRGQNTGVPTSIRFYKEDSSGNELTPTNSGVYEVVEVINDTSCVLAGSFTAENNLRYIVVGSYTLGTALSDEQKEGLYNFNSCKVEFIAEEVLDTEPVIGFTADKQFYLARVYHNSGTNIVTVQDKRSDYWRLDFGEIIVSDKADKNADNMTDTGDIDAWRTALEVDQFFEENLLASDILSISTGGSYNIADGVGFVNISYSSTVTNVTCYLPNPGELNKGAIVFIKVYLSYSTSGLFALYNQVAVPVSLYSESGGGSAAIFNRTIICRSDGIAWRIMYNQYQGLATTVFSGIQRNGTDAEIQSGTANVTVTGSSLAARTASDTRTGIQRNGTNAEVQAGVLSTVNVTPLGLRTQLAWVNFTLLNSWLNGYDTPRYMRDNLGFVHLDGGMIGNGATDSHCFTLPTGFRPVRRIVHYLTSNDGTVTPIYIEADGEIAFSGTYTKTWSIAGIVFSTQ
jgi:hypothetical protein